MQTCGNLIVRHDNKRQPIPNMKNILKVAILTSLCIGLVYTLIVLFTEEGITKKQAIKLAEKFIVDNGYTVAPADKTKMSYELFDQYKDNIEKVLRGRHNTLQPKAFCISEDVDRWTIGFLSITVDLDRLNSTQRQTDLPGRAVVVMKNGKEVSVAHRDPAFSYFKKL